MAWLIGVFCKLFFSKGVVNVVLKDGTELKGKTHPLWLTGYPADCMITTLDLKDAYKKYGIHAADRNKSVVALKSDVPSRVEFYMMNCLPFGSVSSVHNFNRIARLVWALGILYLKIPWLNYYDDYPMVSPSAIATSSMSSAKGLLHVLGISFSETKLKPFDRQGEVLGLVVDTGDFGKGKIHYKMKETRRVDILEELKTIMDEQKVTPAKLPSSSGRMQFAEGGKLAMADLREFVSGSTSVVSLEPSGLEAVAVLAKRFEKNTNRILSLLPEGKPVLVYTDGSFEDERGAIGGVILAEGVRPQVFGCDVPKILLDEWHEQGKEHLIGLVELYAVVVARMVWRDMLAGRRCIFFIDNWGVLDSVIPGTSRDKSWRTLLLELERIDFSSPTWIWACRVPSESNISDAPSRGHLNGLEFLGKIDVVTPICPLLKIPLHSVVCELKRTGVFSVCVCTHSCKATLMYV